MRKTTSLRSFVFILAVICPLIPLATNAASDVSARFDGRYKADIRIAESMSAPDCPDLRAAPVNIEKGIFRAATNTTGFKGFVTEEGFITGHFIRPGQSNIIFEGRFSDPVFSGGLIDDAANCAWLVTLTKD